MPLQGGFTGGNGEKGRNRRLADREEEEEKKRKTVPKNTSSPTRLPRSPSTPLPFGRVCNICASSPGETLLLAPGTCSPPAPCPPRFPPSRADDPRGAHICLTLRLHTTKTKHRPPPSTASTASTAGPQDALLSSGCFPSVSPRLH